MPKSRRTRFVISVDGKLIEIFFVKNLEQKGLLLSHCHPEYFLDEDGPYLLHGEQHHSVHEPKNGKFTVTRRVKAGGDLLEDNALVIIAGDDYLWPIYAHRPPVYRADRDDDDPNNKDDVIEFSKHTNESTLLYAVFAVSLLWNPTINCCRFNFKVVRFSIYQIVLVWCYMSCPTDAEGYILGKTTSSTRINKKFSENHLQIDAVSYQGLDLFDVASEMFLVLRTQFLVAASKHYGEGHRFIPYLEKLTENLTKQPMRITFDV